MYNIKINCTHKLLPTFHLIIISDVYGFVIPYFMLQNILRGKFDNQHGTNWKRKKKFRNGYRVKFSSKRKFYNVIVIHIDFGCEQLRAWP